MMWARTMRRVLALASIVFAFLGPDELRAGPHAPHVVLLIGEDEYETARTLPNFAAKELAPHGIRWQTVSASKTDPDDFPGIEEISQADLVVLSVRRRTPP